MVAMSNPKTRHYLNVAKVEQHLAVGRGAAVANQADDGA
jgi:hypothetical protein